ncbi:hypothetical protein HYPSUDRAFT_48710 [Hypholoma sublateritium FD-334 SS-4]|uniref:Uncharacterized protein n=1 Tax=Hypholoma sublateritium (strain FD-334 SS-4) TaxID=945553 RepID=A0A0D2NEB9_HYPSF|nr:hypothetical protein HYPSUDRAFT_48710 [Hypholoma sublateritium FD-334 SS-4]
MPPKMRKRWMHREVEARNSRRDVPPQKDTLFSMSPGSDVMSVDAAFRNGGVGLGIRFDIPEAEHGESPTGYFIEALSNRARLTDEVPPTRTPPPSSEHDLPTDLPDHAERSQSEHPETSLMPPPPLPAPRDTSPVSPQYLSPTTPTPSPPSPHLATPSPTHNFANGRRSPRIAHAEHGDHSDRDAAATRLFHDPYQQAKGAIAPPLATSPLHDFANLSLLSPAALAQARAQAVSRAPFSTLSEPDDAARETEAEAEAPRDDDVDMESGEDEEHKGGEQQLAEQPAPVDEGMEVQDEVEWSPLRRVEKVPVVEVEVHAASDHEPPSSSPEVEAVRQSVMLTVSPLDSVASTPTARLSPQPVVATVIPPVNGAVEEEEGVHEQCVAKMQVDEQHPDVPVQSTPCVAVPENTAPPPANFFDTDDPDEWKRQMETSVSLPFPARAPSPEVVHGEPDEDDAAQKTPIPTFVAPRERLQSEDSLRSGSPFEEITVTVVVQDEAEVEEPPPQSCPTADSEPPPASAESSAAVEPLMGDVETPRPTVESPDAPLPAKDTNFEPTVGDHVVSPVEQSTAATPRQDSQEPTSPATQPKVKKITLREFVERKKQLREEMEAAKSAQASPMSATSALAADEREGQGQGGGATPKSSTASPAIVNFTPQWMREPAVAAGPVAATPKAPDAVPTQKDKDLGELQALTLAKAAENLAEIAKRSVNLKAFQESTKHSAIKPEWLLAKTAIGNDKLLDAPGAPALSTSVVPAPVSKPLEQRPTLNGYHQPPRVPSQPPVLPSFVSKAVPITSTPPPPSMHVSTPIPAISAVNTREAKKELIDIPMSSLSATRPSTLKPDIPPISSPYLAPPMRSMYPDRSISPMGPDLAHSFHFRRPSHEDGEIGEGSPPIVIPRSSGANSTFMPKTRPFASGLPPVPSSSHSPPTGPRSLYAPSASPTPSFSGGGGSHYRPAPPPHVVPPGSAAAANRPLPPSAPRALRNSMMSGRSGGGGGGGGGNASSSSYPYGGSQYIPRGPLADQRDRDRDRDHSRPYRRRPGGGRAR